VPSPESQYPFDPYDFDVSLYGDALAAYAAGRLVQRLEWHHQQWIVLAAEDSCPHRLPPEDRLVIDESEAYSLADRKLALRRIESALQAEMAAQRRLSRKIREQLPGVIARFPTAAKEPLLRKLRPLLDELFTIDKATLSDRAGDLAAELQERAGDERVESIRDEELLGIVTTFSLKGIDRIQRAMLYVMNDRLEGSYRVGRVVEQGLCPGRVFLHMSLADPTAISLPKQLGVDDLHNGVASAAGFTLAYHSFEPGSLKLTAAWRTACRQALQAEDLWTAEMSLLLQPGRRNVKPDLSEAKTNPEQRPQAQAFRCRCSANAKIKEIVSALHDQLVETLDVPKIRESKAAKAATSAPREPIVGAYGERLELVSPRQAKLIRQGTEIEVRGRKQVLLLETLIRGKGSCCSHRKLLPSGGKPIASKGGPAQQSLHTAIYRLNRDVLSMVKLEAESESGEGYKLVEANQEK